MLFSSRSILTLLLLVCPFFLSGQTNFRAKYESNNPAPLSSALRPDVRYTIHKNWLEKARSKKDTFDQIIGNIYLFHDFLSFEDTPTASTHLLHAENLAQASRNEGWQGGVAYHRGKFDLMLKAPDAAIASFEKAVLWCTTASDSLCVAESLAEIKTLYEFERSQNKALIAQKKIGLILLVFSIIFWPVLIILWRWRLKRNQFRSEVDKDLQNLQVTTRSSSETNETPAVIKEPKTHSSSPAVDTTTVPAPKSEEEAGHLNLFDLSILTTTDWTEFKVLFDKSNPGYLQDIREAFPTITESEERLFVLIKLKLKSKEISNLLGISVNSVKKTRNRLRKKLPLSADDSLEGFIQSFRPKQG